MPFMYTQATMAVAHHTRMWHTSDVAQQKPPGRADMMHYNIPASLNPEAVAVLIFIPLTDVVISQILL
jgi:hypothetical protein